MKVDCLELKLKRLKQDISNIDRIYYSFEINLANPNGEDNPSQYIFLEESYPIKILSFTLMHR